MVQAADAVIGVGGSGPLAQVVVQGAGASPEGLADLYQFLYGQTQVPLGRIQEVSLGQGRGPALQLTVGAPAIAPLLQCLYQRLRQYPCDVWVLVALGTLRLQCRTRHGQDLLALLPAVETLLPARQVFQAQALAYAQEWGELTPVAQAQLEMLRHRLQIPAEEAEEMISQALGPWRDRQAKLEKYQAVLAAEALRVPDDPGAMPWPALAQLAQSLGLTAAEVAPLHAPYQTPVEVLPEQAPEPSPAPDSGPMLETPIPDPDSAEETQLGPTPVVTRLIPPPPVPTPPVDYTEAYRAEFRGAIAASLYPSEFDRGRLEQARRFWHLTPATVQDIEQAETAARYGPITSERGVDYSRLRQLLWAQQWQEADQETERLILSLLSQDMRPLTPEGVAPWPCQDWQTVDALWAFHSQGRFGFKVQWQCFDQAQRRGERFLLAVGWRTKGQGVASSRSLPYRDLTFSLEAPLGHLPSWRWGCATLDSRYEVSEALVEAVFDRAIACGIDTWPQVTPSPPEEAAAPAESATSASPEVVA